MLSNTCLLFILIFALVSKSLGNASCISFTTSSIPSSNPSPTPNARFLPISSLNSVDGDWIPKKDLIPFNTDCPNPLILSNIQLVALEIPFHKPFTKFKPTSASCPNPLSKPLTIAEIICGICDTNWGIAFIKPSANLIIRVIPACIILGRLLVIATINLSIITGILLINCGRAFIIPSINANIISIPASIINPILSINVCTIKITALTIVGINVGSVCVIPWISCNKISIPACSIIGKFCIIKFTNVVIIFNTTGINDGRVVNIPFTIFGIIWRANCNIWGNACCKTGKIFWIIVPNVPNIVGNCSVALWTNDVISSTNFVLASSICVSSPPNTAWSKFVPLSNTLFIAGIIFWESTFVIPDARIPVRFDHPSFIISVCPLNVFEALIIAFSKRPPSPVIALKLSSTIWYVISPLLILSCRLCILSPVLLLISSKGLNPASINCLKSWPFNFPALDICPIA